VSRQEEQAALEHHQATERERTAAAGHVADLERRLAAATAAAGGDDPVELLEAAAARALAEADELEALAATAAQTAAAVADFAQAHEGWVRERVALDEQARALRLQARADRTRLRELTIVLDDARGEDPSITARATRLAALADDLEALARQVESVERLGDEVAGALERAERAGRERGVASLERVLTDARDDTALAEIEERQRQHATDLAAVREQLAEPVLAALDGSPAPDLEAMRERVRAAELDRSEAVAALTTATARATALQRLARTVTAVLAERAPVAAAHRTVDSLSRLAEGKSADNRLRMSLSGYVLAARLEQVAASASERLLRMSSGRYQLVHAAEPGSARARGGLALRVLDGWTGVERDPATLSGGESFSASLALALGLADVVVAEAGGALLETLFVDEGFGSLDDETLDEVMGVLDGLRDGGRTVGLVSHVADLRQRVPVQLRVEKGRDGSRVHQ
jgi:exonuclease SbcC